MPRNTPFPYVQFFSLYLNTKTKDLAYLCLRQSFPQSCPIKVQPKSLKSLSTKVFKDSSVDPQDSSVSIIPGEFSLLIDGNQGTFPKGAFTWAAHCIQRSWPEAHHLNYISRTVTRPSASSKAKLHVLIVILPSLVFNKIGSAQLGLQIWRCYIRHYQNCQGQGLRERDREEKVDSEYFMRIELERLMGFKIKGQLRRWKVYKSRERLSRQSDRETGEHKQHLLKSTLN